jgi:protein-tyrosine phosphatase
MHLLFVCHGNICRSTMAESVMAHLLTQAHLNDAITVDSVATSTEEIGNPPHYGTRNELARRNIPL